MPTFQRTCGLGIVAFVLMVAWSWAVPIFEAPDEPDHWQYVLYVRQHGQLPLYGPAAIEANSPPLYYVFAALFVSPAVSEADVPRRLNKIEVGGVLQRPPGPRLFEPAGLTQYWPLRLVRLATAALSALTVLVCYWAGHSATGKRSTGLLAAGLTLLLPQFTFRGMNISNDVMVTLWCAVATYLVIRLVQRGYTWRVGVTASVAMALAFLSKISSLFVPVTFALAILSVSSTWRARLGRLTVLIIALALVAPWLMRNQSLYGDPFASRAMLTAVGDLVQPRPITSPYFVTVFPVLLFLSFIGYFGWITLWLPGWLYLLYGGLVLAALAGLVWRVSRGGPERRLVLLLATLPMLNVLVVVYINLTFTQPQGRYLFPALPALAVLGALGFEGLPRWSERAGRVLWCALLALNVGILALIVVPAYWLAR